MNFMKWARSGWVRQYPVCWVFYHMMPVKEGTATISAGIDRLFGDGVDTSPGRLAEKD